MNVWATSHSTYDVMIWWFNIFT